MHITYVNGQTEKQKEENDRAQEGWRKQGLPVSVEDWMVLLVGLGLADSAR